jgi:hypothetical protein
MSGLAISPFEAISMVGDRERDDDQEPKTMHVVPKLYSELPKLHTAICDE